MIKIRICQNCSHKWSWKQAFTRSSFTLGDGMTCPYCKEKQYISSSSRKLNSLFVLLSVVPIFLSIFLDLSIITALMIAISIGVIIIGINPFIIKLSNEDKLLE